MVDIYDKKMKTTSFYVFKTQMLFVVHIGYHMIIN